MKTDIMLLVCLVVFGFLGLCQGGELMMNFYAKTCPLAEEIVKNVTWSHVSSNPNLPAKLLRLHFHDCFVRGCEGSILLNSTANSTAEKDATPNLSLAGFDVIDDVKAQLENACPGVVSCADIVALAARDSVSFQSTSIWDVLTGRRDGTVSLASEALANLPAATFNFTSLSQRFASKGLSVQDLVVLSGAHTIGIGHCNLFSYRLYNFTGKGDADPSLNPAYAAFLRTKCKSLSDNTTTVGMDPDNRAQDFGNDYFKILKQHKGLFQSDAALLTDNGASNAVELLLDSNRFFTQFAESIKSMGAIGVLTGTAGEIRKNCRFCPCAKPPSTPLHVDNSFLPLPAQESEN
ncbi:hypothetical protein L1049_004749 [Liquidambar formosana]|uniref:Peroxidase n=1 Tax=Liquidambar formosana TaxID=63359 RepID=A0AAP0X0Z9_LIQFO